MKIKDNENNTVLIFGDGDISTGLFKTKDQKVCGICFHECDKGEIGRPIYSDDLKGKEVYIRMAFKNISSLNIVIDIFLKLKKIMEYPDEPRTNN